MDTISGSFFVLLALVLYYMIPYQIPEGRQAPGPRFLPTIIVVLIGILGLIVLVQSLKNPSADEEKIGINTRVLIPCLIFSAYAVFLKYTGFFLTSFLALFFLMWHSEVKHFSTIIIISILIPLGLIFFAQNVLEVILPFGDWFYFLLN